MAIEYTLFDPELDLDICWIYVSKDKSVYHDLNVINFCEKFVKIEPAQRRQFATAIHELNSVKFSSIIFDDNVVEQRLIDLKKVWGLGFNKKHV